MQTDFPTSSRVLVVDDDEVMRELLDALLEMGGHTAVLAATGAQALELLAQSPAPDVLLTDLQMPGLEGAALVKALRSASPAGAPVLGMSANQPAAEVLGLLDGFLSKPFSPEELEEALHRFGLEQAHGRAERSCSNNPATASSPAPSRQESAAVSGPVLDDPIFAAMMQRFPAAQLLELYQLTLDDVRERQARMVADAEAGDLEAVQREAHAIKGSCGMVGARELQRLATTIEKGTTLDSAALAEIPAACERLRRMLDAKLQR